VGSVLAPLIRRIDGSGRTVARPLARKPRLRHAGNVPKLPSLPYANHDPYHPRRHAHPSRNQADHCKQPRRRVSEVRAAVGSNDVVVVGMMQNPFPKKARKGIPYVHTILPLILCFACWAGLANATVTGLIIESYKAATKVSPMTGETAKTNSLINKSQAMLKAGDKAGAIQTLEMAASIRRAEHTSNSEDHAKAIERIISQLRGDAPPDFPPRIPHATRELDTVARLVAAGDSLKDVLNNLPENLRALVETIGAALPLGTRFVFAKSKVKRFATSFVEGANNARKYLTRARETHPALVDAWLKTPLARRVFMAGSGHNLREITNIQKALEERGYTVFFYKFCEERVGTLCSSQAVGAFFSTAGHALLFDTTQAKDSSYVELEVKAVSRLVQHEGPLIIITPREALGAAAGTAVSVVKVTFEPAITK
jgi:hypothetical protein